MVGKGEKEGAREREGEAEQEESNSEASDVPGCRHVCV